MLVVVKPCRSKSTRSQISWLKLQITQKKLHAQWFFTSGNFEKDVLEIRTLAKAQGVVVVIGGDGTIHLVVNAIVELDCRLALLPSGTGNDFARQFGLTQFQWRHSLFCENITYIDLGCVNGRYFINMMGLGFSAAVVQGISATRKRHGLSYLWEGLKRLFGFSNITVNSPFSSQRQSTMMLLFANGRYFAAGIESVPSADPSDGTLTCIQLSPKSIFERLMVFMLMLISKHEIHNCVSKTEIVHFHIETPHLDIEADGEVIGQTPANVCVAPRAIKLLVSLSDK